MAASMTSATGFEASHAAEPAKAAVAAAPGVPEATAAVIPPAAASGGGFRLGPAAEALCIPIAALLAAMLLFGLFMLVLGQSPVEVYGLIYQGGFGSGFSW